MRVLGIDPGLRNLGWGIVEVKGNTYTHIGCGTLSIPSSKPLAERLAHIHRALSLLIETYQPTEAAVEEVFVNMNPASTLKLGMARGVALMVPALYNIPVGEYPPNKIKKSVVGSGHATKDQIILMVRHFLPKAVDEKGNLPPDAADALAVAICHINIGVRAQTMQLSHTSPSSTKVSIA